MALTADQIRQVAHLARLELPPEQVEKYARELSNILEMVGQLSQRSPRPSPSLSAWSGLNVKGQLS